MYKTEELFDLEHTICKKYLQECEYPWEALPLIKKFIKELRGNIIRTGKVCNIKACNSTTIIGFRMIQYCPRLIN